MVIYKTPLEQNKIFMANQLDVICDELMFENEFSSMFNIVFKRKL